MNKDYMIKAGFAKEVAEVEAGICPFCHQPINYSDFKDQISRDEYHFSDLCQQCQDETFDYVEET